MADMRTYVVGTAKTPFTTRTFFSKGRFVYDVKQDGSSANVL